MARVASILYAGFAAIVLGCGVFGPAFRSEIRQPSELIYLVLIVLYGVGLSYGADRLQSASLKQQASASICVLLLAHASGILLGVSTALWGSSERAHEFRELGGAAVTVGLVTGWIPAYIPFQDARRGGALWMTACAGPALVMVMQPNVYR